MLFAIAEIKDQADHKPNKQPHPIRPAETVNHRAANYNAERGNNRDSRYAKPAFQIGTRGAHDPNSGANENERKQRSDAGHLADDVLGDERRENSSE